MSTEIVKIVIKSYHVVFDKLVQLVQKKSKFSYIGAAILLISIQQVISYFKAPKNLRHIPKVSSIAMIKSFLGGESRLDRINRLLLPASDKGNGFYLSKFPFNWTVFVSNPMAAKQLCLKSEIFPKSHLWLDMLGSNGVITKFIGSSSVVMANGEEWKKQRALINPFFHRSMPIKTMGGVVLSFFSAIDKEGCNVDVSTVMQKFTLDVLGATAFGYNFQSLHGDPENWIETFETVSDGSADPTVAVFSYLDPLFLLISPARKRCQVALESINKKFDEMAKEKRDLIQKGTASNAPENEKDLLTLMLEAVQKGEAFGDPIDLRHNIATFFLAGHETTSVALAFCLYNLAQSKYAQRKLRQEIVDVMGDEPIDAIPTLEELRRMDYLNLIIKENLRLFGPVNIPIPRRATEDVNLAGTFIPKGTDISLDIQCLHHDPNVWKDPNQFVPERFQGDGEYSKHQGLTYLPFSSGSRQCVGMNFSLTEQRIFLAMTGSLIKNVYSCLGCLTNACTYEVRRYEIDISAESNRNVKLVSDTLRTRAPKNLELIFKKRY